MLYQIKLYTKVSEDEDDGYYSKQLAESDSLETIKELWEDFKDEDFNKDDELISLFKDEANLEEYYLPPHQRN